MKTTTIGLWRRPPVVPGGIVCDGLDDGGGGDWTADDPEPPLPPPAHPAQTVNNTHRMTAAVPRTPAASLAAIGRRLARRPETLDLLGRRAKAMVAANRHRECPAARAMRRSVHGDGRWAATTPPGARKRIPSEPGMICRRCVSIDVPPVSRPAWGPRLLNPSTGEDSSPHRPPPNHSHVLPLAASARVGGQRRAEVRG